MSSASGLQMFALIDGAIFPSQIQTLIEGAGQPYRSLFMGMPEEELGPASPFLVQIESTQADWVREMDRFDIHTPSLLLLWSRFDIDELTSHLQAFLLAGIGDGMTALIRYYDPRVMAEVFRVWGDATLKLFMSPITQLMYRGRNPDWQTIEGDSEKNGRVCRSIVIELTQSELDQLTAYTEPDEMLATLVDMGIADGSLPYSKRLADFMPRYERALHWGLAQPADRLEFCQQTYVYGDEFERHVCIREMLLQRRESGESFSAAMEKIPEGVWEMLAQTTSVTMHAIRTAYISAD